MDNHQCHICVESDNPVFIDGYECGMFTFALLADKEGPWDMHSRNIELIIQIGEAVGVRLRCEDSTNEEFVRIFRYDS